VTSYPKYSSGAAVLSPDERIAFYLGSAPSGVYQVERASRTAPFGAPVALPSLKYLPGISFQYINVSADGLTMLLEASGGNADLYVARRKSVNQAFGTPTPFYTFNTFPPVDARGPYLRGDGSEVFFFAKYTGAQEIYRAPIAGGAVGSPVVQTSLILPVPGYPAADATFPVVSYDGRVVFFARGLSGGGIGIWTATRPTTSSNFGAPGLVTELSLNLNEQAHWVSPDGCRLYFQRDAALWIASRGK
jgi:hypothetical protein